MVVLNRFFFYLGDTKVVTSRIRQVIVLHRNNCMDIDLGRLNVSHLIEVVVLVGIIVLKKGAPTVLFTNECLTRRQEGRILSDCSTWKTLTVVIEIFTFYPNIINIKLFFFVISFINDKNKIFSSLLEDHEKRETQSSKIVFVIFFPSLISIMLYFNIECSSWMRIYN